MAAVTELVEGASILFPEGPRVVVAVGPLSARLRDISGEVWDVGWAEIGEARGIHGAYVDAVAPSMSAMWEGLPAEAKDEALDRLEVVLTILTGYSRGHAALARPGEPFTDFDPARRSTLRTRIRAMGRQLAREAMADRRRVRAEEQGERPVGARLGPVTDNTLRNWVNAYQRPFDGGLYALVDGRRRRQYSQFDSLPPLVREVADRQLLQLDGSRSVLSVDELFRRTCLEVRRVAEKTNEGPEAPKLSIPESTLRAYLSHALRGVGATTRAQTTNHLRGASAFTSYPALRPGQVVAIDVTRADNLVWDPWSERVISVEIITALDVASRVVLGLRVIPRSANAFEAGLILYDVLRPFSMSVSAEVVSDWRWAGVPERVGFIDDALVEAERLSGRPLVGEHIVPGLVPDAIRADNGSIFTSSYFRELCAHMGIHLLLSRGKKPTDNAFVERWHETLQRCLIQVYGHKGRNPSQRGSDVGKIRRDTQGRYVFKGDGPLLTARELERHIREFIVTDYHRTWHQGISVVGRGASVEEAELRMSPLEVFDALVAATGRIRILQRPDLMYDFLPMVWGTIQHDGVEFKNVTYDCSELEEFRNVPRGYFRDGDRAAPFFRDPNDVSRVWLRHPTTGDIIEVPWRKRHLLQAPMTETMLRVATSAVRRRGGNVALSRSSTQRELLEVLNDVGDLDRLRRDSDLSDWRISMLTSAQMRAQRSSFEHAEAAAAGAVATMAHPVRPSGGMDTAGRVPSAGLVSSEFDPHVDPWPAHLFEDPTC